METTTTTNLVIPKIFCSICNFPVSPESRISHAHSHGLSMREMVKTRIYAFNPSEMLIEFSATGTCPVCNSEPYSKDYAVTDIWQDGKRIGKKQLTRCSNPKCETLFFKIFSLNEGAITDNKIKKSLKQKLRSHVTCYDCLFGEANVMNGYVTCSAYKSIVEIGPDSIECAELCEEYEAPTVNNNKRKRE